MQDNADTILANNRRTLQAMFPNSSKLCSTGPCSSCYVHAECCTISREERRNLLAFRIQEKEKEAAPLFNRPTAFTKLALALEEQ